MRRAEHWDWRSKEVQPALLGSLYCQALPSLNLACSCSATM